MVKKISEHAFKVKHSGTKAFFVVIRLWCKCPLRLAGDIFCMLISSKVKKNSNSFCVTTISGFYFTHKTIKWDEVINKWVNTYNTSWGPQVWSLRAPILPVFDVSLLQNSWFKWSGSFQASTALTDELIIRIRYVEGLRHLKQAIRVPEDQTCSTSELKYWWLITISIKGGSNIYGTFPPPRGQKEDSRLDRKSIQKVFGALVINFWPAKFTTKVQWVMSS